MTRLAITAEAFEAIAAASTCWRPSAPRAGWRLLARNGRLLAR
jgi:hypothetical protein